MKATDFTRDDCALGKKRVSYAKLQREYRCNECGGTLTLFWDSYYDDNWHIACAECDSHDFIHDAQLQREQADALEVLDGLPPKLAAALR